MGKCLQGLFLRFGLEEKNKIRSEIKITYYYRQEKNIIGGFNLRSSQTTYYLSNAGIHVELSIDIKSLIAGRHLIHTVFNGTF